jgi:hypothetical protein
MVREDASVDSRSTLKALVLPSRQSAEVGHNANTHSRHGLVPRFAKILRDFIEACAVVMVMSSLV